MKASDIPAKFPIPFGSSAGAPYIRPIPVASQIGVTPGAASLTDGWVPLNMTPLSAGGIPPDGRDMNGIMKQTTQWSQWQCAAAPVNHDTTFSTAIGGYPKGALLASATFGNYWLCLIDDNTSDPNAGGTNWHSLSLLGGTNTTGDMKFRETAEILPGWVIANATTIGNSASNATQLADPSTFNLYAWHWSNFSNTQCPVYTSGGAPTTRGVSAVTDYAANKAIQVRDWRGVGPMGVDTMQGGATTRLNGVPVVSGGLTVPGSTFGENIHQLIASELPVITPTGVVSTITPAGTVSTITPAGTVSTITPAGSVTINNQNQFSLNTTPAAPPGYNTYTQGSNSIGISASFTGTPVTPSFTGTPVTPSFTGTPVTPSFTGNAFGSNGSHNTTQRSQGVTWYIKL